MVEYILGNYLAETGKLTKQKLIEVMNKHDAVRVKLGLIAISEGMLTAQQAEEINLLQSARDKRFGDIAIEEGMLTEEQVARLLKKQGNAYLVFIQTLVDEEIVTMEELDWLLSDFKKVNGYSNADFEDIKSDEVERILPLVIPEEAHSYLQLIGTVVRTMIRLVDRHVYVGRAVMVDDDYGDSVAIQRMMGAEPLVDGFAERDGALLKMCREFGQEEFEMLDIDALDAAGELLNCANGMYVSELSRNGTFLDLMPPEYQPARDVGTVCRLPIFIGNKGLYFSVGSLN